MRRTPPRAPRAPRLLRHGVDWLLGRIPLLEKEMLLLRHLVSPGDVCVDIGAAGGTYLLLLARLVGEEGRVVGFEPRERSHRRLDWLCHSLGLDQVTVVRTALSDRAGHDRLLVPRNGALRLRTRSFLRRDLDGGADHYYREFTSAHEIDVRSTTLDEFAATTGLERVDLVKCDVEGAEPWVLAGAADTIARWRPAVICEVEARHLDKYGRTPSDVLDWFDRRDYAAFRYRAGRLQRLAAVTSRDHNYVFLPAEQRAARNGRPG